MTISETTESLRVETQPATGDGEALATLVALAGRKTGRIAPELLAEHVLACCPGGEWPIRHAALEALLRRLESATRDGLRVAARPRDGVLGAYVTRRAREAARPYRTWLTSLTPVTGSCDCADFLRGGLGLCKHLLVVLDDVSAPSRIRAAAATQGNGPADVLLTWDPICPLLGSADPLLRLRLALPRRRGRAPAGWVRDSRGGLAPRPDALADRRRRLALVRMLQSATRGADQAEPAAAAILREERTRLERWLQQQESVKHAHRTFASLKQPLYPYQQEGVRRFLEAGRLLLADDMGLGKTAQAIAACHALWRTGAVRRGLVVAPASLKFQWSREWQSFSDAPVAVVDGLAGARAAQYRRTRAGFLVVNYEQVVRDLPALLRWAPDVVVLDEAQRIKNWATRSAASVKVLAPPWRLVLTGTPLENRLDELASIMEWVDDRALEPKWRLLPFHSRFGDGRRQVTGARHLNVLRERLAHSMLRRRRAEILEQLPSRTDTRVNVELTPEQREEHDDLERSIATLVRISERRPLTQAEFLRLMSLLLTQRVIANGLAQLRFAEVWPTLEGRAPTAALLRSLATPKLAELREIVQRIAVDQERRIVVFSQWRRMLKLAAWSVSDLLAEHGLRGVFFTGAESQRRRMQNVVDFHDDPAVRLLFASDAGGVGLNLQRAASCCVALELPWNPAVLEQRVARIHRLGQRRKIDVYHLVSADCIESRIADLVRDKSALFRGLFDGDTDEIRFERSGGFLEGVRRILQPPVVKEEEDVDAGQPDVDELVAAADESADSPEPAGAAAPAADVQRLLSRMQVRRRPDGGVVLEAPPEDAGTLAALFQGMADLLRASGKNGA